MTYRIAPAAARDLRKLTKTDARVILDAIEVYVERGTGDVKKLTDWKPATWRLRVGRFRVRFEREGEGIVVVAISDRRDAYR